MKFILSFTVLIALGVTNIHGRSLEPEPEGDQYDPSLDNFNDFSKFNPMVIVKTGYNLATFGNNVYKDFMNSMKEQGHGPTEVSKKLVTLKNQFSSAYEQEGVRTGRLVTAIFTFIQDHKLEGFMGRTVGEMINIAIGAGDFLGFADMFMVYKGIERNGGIPQTIVAVQTHFVSKGGVAKVAHSVMQLAQKGEIKPAIAIIVETLKATKFDELAQVVESHTNNIADLLGHLVAASKLVDNIIDEFPAILDAAGNHINNAANVVGDHGRRAVNAIGDTANVVGDHGRRAVNAIGDTANDARRAIGGAFDSIGGAFGRLG